MRLQRDSYAPKKCAFDAANVQFLRAHLCKSHPVLQQTAPAENTVSEEQLTIKINGLTQAARPAAQAFYHIGYRDNPQDFYGKAQQAHYDAVFELLRISHVLPLHERLKI